MRNHRYIPGSYLAICDECGRVFYIDQMRFRWDNALVCEDDWEPRHPQLDVRGRRDRIGVPHARPREISGELIMLDTLEMTDGLVMGYSGPTYITTAITPDDL